MRKLITTLRLKVVKCDCGAIMVRDNINRIYKCPRCKSIYDRYGKSLYKTNNRKQSV